MTTIPNYTPVPNKNCPTCGRPLLVINKREVTEHTAHPQFIGCAAWPRCNYKRAMTPEIEAETILSLPKAELTVDF